MKLSTYSNDNFSRGRGWIIELLWLVVQAVFVSSFIPGSFHRRLFLRMFGAGIGRGVVIKPGVRVKFPWRLTVGEYSWIGESVWIDNLDDVIIGANCCLSQGAYLCTGSHDWSSEAFNLIVKPIIVQDHAWICAKAKLGPGIVVEEGAVLALGSTASGCLEAWKIYQGNPASIIGARKDPLKLSDKEILHSVMS